MAQGKEHYGRDIFFREVREDPFPGFLIQEQVDGLNALLDAWEPLPYTDRRWLAYALATALAETGTMLPRHEVKSNSKSYWNRDPATGQVYYGRGWVQLTWKANYEKATKEINERNLIGRKVDLVKNPDEALQKDTAAIILYQGMAEGWFTGKKLSDYFDGPKEDWVNARRIVNLLDRANEIANNAQAFLAALDAAATAREPEQPDDAPDVVRGPDRVLAGLISLVKDRTGASEVRLIIK